MRPLYLSLAAVSFALALVGVVLPLLPTTPLLLLTSWCLLRSSPRLHARLASSRLFGPLLLDWERHRGVRPHVKISALSLLVLVSGLGLAFGELSLLQRGVLLSGSLIGATVVLRLRTIRTPLPSAPAFERERAADADAA